MPGFNQRTCGDTYDSTTPPCTIEDVWTSAGGWLSVSTAGVFMQLQYGSYGSEYWTDEQQLGDGAFASFDANATGARFRNAVAGSNAVVTCHVGEGQQRTWVRREAPQEPVLSISALGTVSTTSGRAPTRQIFAAGGSGTYTTPSAAVAILVEIIGAGGGGGGCATAAAASGSGGGGGGGAYVSALILGPNPSYTYTVGAGGGGGTGAGTSGSSGGSTSFNGSVYTAGGGSGGAGNTATSSFPAVWVGNGGGTPGPNYDLSATGHPGLAGYSGSATVLIRSVGGSSAGPYSGGGTRYGNGGAGGFVINGSVGTGGGAGGDGLIVVTEFY